MFEKFNTTPIDVRTLTAGGEYVLLATTSNAFKGYDWVSVQIWWDSVDVFDGYFELMERKDSRLVDSSGNAVWASVPAQTRSITAASGSEIMQDVDLFANEVSIFINKGSALTGNFYWYVSARKQYGMEDVVAQIKRIADKING
jgi:hypothetical protein